nr:MAG TPA: hypothetical protein [Caudoviricetes sp.]
MRYACCAHLPVRTKNLRWKICCHMITFCFVL